MHNSQLGLINCLTYQWFTKGYGSLIAVQNTISSISVTVPVLFLEHFYVIKI